MDLSCSKVACKLIYEWDVPQSGDESARGWMAEWKIPILQGDDDLEVPMEKPRKWHAGPPLSKPGDHTIHKEIDDVTVQIHCALDKFNKAADKTEIDMEGFGKDGSKNNRIKEKQTHGYASFPLPIDFKFICPHDCQLNKKGFVRMQETGLLLTTTTTTFTPTTLFIFVVVEFVLYGF